MKVIIPLYLLHFKDYSLNTGTFSIASGSTPIKIDIKRGDQYINCKDFFGTDGTLDQLINIYHEQTLLEYLNHKDALYAQELTKININLRVGKPHIEDNYFGFAAEIETNNDIDFSGLIGNFFLAVIYTVLSEPGPLRGKIYFGSYFILARNNDDNLRYFEIEGRNYHKNNLFFHVILDANQQIVPISLKKLTNNFENFLKSKYFNEERSARFLYLLNTPLQLIGLPYLEEVAVNLFRMLEMLPSKNKEEIEQVIKDQGEEDFYKDFLAIRRASVHPIKENNLGKPLLALDINERNSKNYQKLMETLKIKMKEKFNDKIGRDIAAKRAYQKLYLPILEYLLSVGSGL